jgi:hypothetical protein
MEAMLGISLYSYFLSEISKNAMSFLLFCMLSLQQNLRTKGQAEQFCLEVRGEGWEAGGEVAQCRHM